MVKARSLLSSRLFHMWCPTPGRYWVRSMAGSLARIVVAHWRICEEHSAISSIVGIVERFSCGVIEDESFIVCWIRRLAAGLKEKLAAVSSVGMRWASLAQ